MPMMPLNDSMFLLAESREHPVHVGGLQLFRLPQDAGPDYVASLYREFLATQDVRRVFGRRPRQPVTTLGQWSWAQDEHPDLEYHVRHSALPKPGRVRELLELVSRLHGYLLDRHRPLWEMHLIEGLEDNRFGIYTKAHHALMDGVTALHVLQSALSTDPDLTGAPAPFAAELDGESGRGRSGSGGGGGGVLDVPREVADRASGAARTLNQLAGLAPALTGKIVRGLREQSETLPYQAPRSMLNVPITGARRFAAQDWPLERLRAVRKATGATLNDVMLAMCAGALRHYLLDQNALPERPLVALVPVSVGAEEGASRGNSLGAILCELATDATDPATRLERIRASMDSGKAAFQGLSTLQVMLLSAFAAGGLALQPLPGVPELTRPPFNLIISNVPGPQQPLYYNGAALEGIYPLSIPYDGQALNITCTSYVDRLDFGLTGCRRSVPHLQRLLAHLDTALVELEKVAATG